MNDNATRNQLRRQLRDRRNALTDSDQAQAAQRLTARVKSCRFYRTSQRVALYLPNDGEIDPQPLIEALWSAGKTCYLPVLSRLRYDRLWFAPYAPETGLHFNRFGIAEPRVPATQRVRAQDLDLILMPLVAFDPRGNRLGMGGGYYDKSLAFLRHRRYWHKPHLVGLAHDFQHVAQLEANPWDVPLQAAITDQNVYFFQT